MRHSTPYQRLQIRMLFHDLELPSDYITKLNLTAFDAAKVPRPAEGIRVDSALDALDQDQASRLIAALKQQRDG